MCTVWGDKPAKRKGCLECSWTWDLMWKRWHFLDGLKRGQLYKDLLETRGYRRPIVGFFFKMGEVGGQHMGGWKMSCMAFWSMGKEKQDRRGLQFGLTTEMKGSRRGGEQGGLHIDLLFSSTFLPSLEILPSVAFLLFAYAAGPFFPLFLPPPNLFFCSRSSLLIGVDVNNCWIVGERCAHDREWESEACRSRNGRVGHTRVSREREREGSTRPPLFLLFSYLKPYFHQWGMKFNGLYFIFLWSHFSIWS